MLILRPVKPSDLDHLLDLAKLTGFGLTTLPHDRDFLKKRIKSSTLGFAHMEDDQKAPRGESYLFVMEDLKTGRVVGTCGIFSKVGGFEPFYAYRLEKTTIESKSLGVKKEIAMLHLVTEHNGPCEIGSLFLHPDYRKGGNGRLLSVARFLFMAEHPEYFDPTVIAEMRGVIDDHGRSPFWDAIGKHFFEIDFPKADHLSMLNKRFIADLMPKHPLYVTLLPKEAQQVIGQVHEQTAPALKILEAEGFTFDDKVDIFEAGPVVTCQRDQIRSARTSLREKIADVTDDPIDSPPHAIATTSHAMRAAIGPVAQTKDGVRIPGNVALALGVKVGDHVRFVPLRREGEAPAEPRRKN